YVSPNAAERIKQKRASGPNSRIHRYIGPSCSSGDLDAISLHSGTFTRCVTYGTVTAVRLSARPETHSQQPAAVRYWSEVQAAAAPSFSRLNLDPAFQRLPHFTLGG